MAGEASLGSAGPGAASVTTQQHIGHLWSPGGMGVWLEPSSPGAAAGRVEFTELVSHRGGELALSHTALPQHLPMIWAQELGKPRATKRLEGPHSLLQTLGSLQTDQEG